MIQHKAVSWANPLASGSEYESSDYDIDLPSTLDDEYNHPQWPFLDRKSKANTRGFYTTRKRPSYHGPRRM